MKKLYSIEVRGSRSRWGVNWYATRKEVAAMRADGVDVFEIVNILPGWIVEWGLADPYIFLQDLWNLRNPFGGSQ